MKISVLAFMHDVSATARKSSKPYIFDIFGQRWRCWTHRESAISADALLTHAKVRSAKADPIYATISTFAILGNGRMRSS